ncbi:CLUMA_CG008792, isoform A [Clunio marinus]|uniref:CLUMA_CG008792, isoform A n=1 Tax=Clunio marinus TaxID=568069 RepID=A0A1J1I4M0_9DIPT|nr:CLUMA_CG008792, isoform A [Clunio marinus]
MTNRNYDDANQLAANEANSSYSGTQKALAEKSNNDLFISLGTTYTTSKCNTYWRLVEDTSGVVFEAERYFGKYFNDTL